MKEVTSNAKIRQSNFELMRIISMFMIVLWHVIIQSTAVKSYSTMLVLDILRSLLVVHVNSFILLTGYFQCKSRFHMKKLLSLIGTSWFYRILALIIFFLLGLGSLTTVEIISNAFVLPLDHEHWFIHCYILLYLLSPLLNKFIERVNHKELKATVILLFIVNCILPYLTNQRFFTTNFGFSLYHFITLYFIGAYMRKYPIKDSYHFKNMSIKSFRWFNVFLFLGCAFFTLTITYFGRYITDISHGSGSFLYYVGQWLQSVFGNYDFPFIVIQSCCYFLFFSTLQFKSKIINFLSPMMIGIYLIHESELLKPYMYQQFVNFIQGMSSGNMLLSIFGFAILIFIVCLFIEGFRIFMVKNIKRLWSFIKKKHAH